MKNSDIISLVRCGILSMTSHDLPSSEAYKTVRLKMEVQRAYKSLSEAEMNILSECGIHDVERHNARQKELSSKLQRTEAEQSELRNIIEGMMDKDSIRAIMEEQKKRLEEKDKRLAACEEEIRRLEEELRGLRKKIGAAGR